MSLEKTEFEKLAEQYQRILAQSGLNVVVKGQNPGSDHFEPFIPVVKLSDQPKKAIPRDATLVALGEQGLAAPEYVLDCLGQQVAVAQPLCSDGDPSKHPTACVKRINPDGSVVIGIPSESEFTCFMTDTRWVACNRPNCVSEWNDELSIHERSERNVFDLSDLNTLDMSCGTLANAVVFRSKTCTFCGKLILPHDAKVPDENGNPGDEMHLSCSVELADGDAIDAECGDK